MTSIQNIPKLFFYMIPSAMAIALGCNGPDDLGTSSSSASSSSTSSAGSGGAGGGGSGAGGEHCTCLGHSVEPCMWSGTIGSISIPDCPVQNTTIFQGTIDGKPYNETFTDTALSSFAREGTFPPFRAHAYLPGDGQLLIEWGEPNLRGNVWPLTKGQLRLPNETLIRMVQPGSMTRLSCDDFAFQYVLTVDGGQLVGCSNG